MDLPDGSIVPARPDGAGLGEAPAPALRLPSRRTVAVLAIAGAPLLVAALFLRPRMQQPWTAGHYLTVHIVVEALVCTTAFATFAVQWYAAGARLNDARARFVGSGFLAVALLELVHLLAFPGMPGLFWIESSTERGIVYWVAARCCATVTLVGALAVAPEDRSRALRRTPLLACAVGFVAAVLLADHLWISRQPIFFVEGQGLTALKKALEGAVALAALAGVVLYQRHHRREGDASSRHLATALALTVLSELCFMSYARAYDSFNLLGHLYLLLASYAVFHALFAEAVIGPYERLGATTRDLRESNAELRRLRTHIEGELEVTIRNLRAMQDQREDYLRAASHDLRMPLQVVLLRAESLARAVPAGSREQRLARTMVAAARQMGSMIQDLVHAVHLESGAVALSRQRVELEPFIHELLALVAGALETHRVTVELPRHLPAVAADPERLARVLQNLLANALKYSCDDASVTVRARPAGDELVVTVEDHGVGIQPEHLPRLFERFYRVDASRQRGGEGAGLGLAITQSIVAAHRGTLSVQSDAERTRFDIVLPRAGAAADAGT